MSNVFLVIGSIFVGIAALIHVVIFYFESVAWSKPVTWKRFGLESQQDADVVKPMALNQGYYNAFLALAAILGLILIQLPAVQQAGLALALYSTLSMVLAATVLIISNPKLARAAVTQGAAPLVAIVFLALALFTA